MAARSDAAAALEALAVKKAVEAYQVKEALRKFAEEQRQLGDTAAEADQHMADADDSRVTSAAAAGAATHAARAASVHQHMADVDDGAMEVGGGGAPVADASPRAPWDGLTFVGQLIGAEPAKIFRRGGIMRTAQAKQQLLGGMRTAWSFVRSEPPGPPGLGFPNEINFYLSNVAAGLSVEDFVRATDMGLRLEWTGPHPCAASPPPPCPATTLHPPRATVMLIFALHTGG